MNDPKRWSEDGADSFERDLLASAKDDAMSDASKAALFANLGAMGPLAPPPLAAPGELATGAAKGFASASLSTKVIVGLSVVAVLGAAAFAFRPQAPRGDAAATTPAAAAAASAVVAAPTESPPAAVPAVPAVRELNPAGTAMAPAALPSTRKALGSAAEPKNGQPSSPAEIDVDALGRETAALDEVRAALREGDTSRALSRLNAFAKEHPRAVLAEEAAVLRIEAHAARGEHVQATTLGKLWLRVHPKSAYADRIRRAMGQTGAD